MSQIIKLDILYMQENHCNGLTFPATVFRLNQLVKIYKKKNKRKRKLFLPRLAFSPGRRRSRLLGYWRVTPSRTSLLCRRHGAGGHRGGLGLGGGGGTFFLLEGVLAAAHGGDHAMAELLVQADVDHWVVDGRALGKEGWQCHEDRSKFRTLVCENPPGNAGVGQPAYQEADDHDHHHAGDFPLSPLGGLRLLLGGGSFLDGAEQAAVAEEHDGQGSEEVADEHVDDEGLVVESLGPCVVVDSA